VRREGRRLRVSVQLVDAATGYRVWSRTFDEDPRDVLAVQDEIGRQVVDAIGPRFAARALDARPRRVAVDPTTYDLYLQGRYLYLNAGTFDSLQNARAIESFRKAIGRDSSYAPAWAGLADVLGRIGETKPQREAAERALALDPTLADAHASLAHVLAFGERRWNEALREIDRAIELNPGSVLTLLRRSSIYSTLGRDAEAIADVDQAFRLDPLSSAVTQRRAAIYSAAGRWDDAVRIYRTLLTQRPDQPEIHEALALTYLAKGAGDSSAAEFLAERWPWEGKFISDTASAAVARNDRAAIMWFIREGEAGTFPNGRISPLTMASLYTRIGDHDRAFAMLERAHVETMGYRSLLLGVLRDPRLIPLRDDPRYAALVARWMAP
jgi:serine/threonine-protein kinase